MLSITRQCTEVCELLAAIQTCVDRQGHVIPARAEEFAIHVASSREYMGVLGGARPEHAARDLYAKVRS